MGLRRSANVLSLGDEVEINLYWPSYYPDTTFVGRVIGFEGNMVRVEALERSTDPLVENEWLVTFRSLNDPRAERRRAA